MAYEHIGIVLLALHLVGDSPLQSDWMAANKLGGGKAHLAHVGVHLALNVTVLGAAYGFDAILIAVFVTGLHALIDLRRWDPSEGLFDAYPIWSDQSLHAASIALALVLFA